MGFLFVCGSWFGEHLVAPSNKGQAEPDRGEQHEVAGEEFEVGAADRGNFWVVGRSQGGFPEGLGAEGGCEGVDENDGGKDKPGGGVTRSEADEMTGRPAPAGEGKPGPDEEGCDEILVPEGGNDIVDGPLDFCNEKSDAQQCELAVDSTKWTGVGSGGKEEGRGKREEGGLHDLHRAVLDGSIRFVREPCREKNDNGAEPDGSCDQDLSLIHI